jgi:hypothetical protein
MRVLSYCREKGGVVTVQLATYMRYHVRMELRIEMEQ